MISPKHPRAISLKIRDKTVVGVKKGITSIHGLIAQGRGEAFDYLIGEKTWEFANKATEAAAAYLVLAEHPILSINGNVAALSAKEYVKLSSILNCPIEVNLFHRSEKREFLIKKVLKNKGAKNITGVGKSATFIIKNIASPRKMVSPWGIAKADVVLVPLEDGDRTEALAKMGKKVLTIDLNPLSRTSQQANVTIVDNIVRAMPNLIKKTEELKKMSKEELKKITGDYDNKKILSDALLFISKRLTDLSQLPNQ